MYSSVQSPDPSGLSASPHNTSPKRRNTPLQETQTYLAVLVTARTSHGLFSRHIYTDHDIPLCKVPFRESQTSSNHRMGQLQKGTQHQSRVHVFVWSTCCRCTGKRRSRVARLVRKHADHPPELAECSGHKQNVVELPHHPSCATKVP